MKSNHDPLASIRQRSFVYYSAANVLASLSRSMVQAILAWHVYDLSGNPLDLGLLGLARFLPALSVALLGGAIADTKDRRKVIVVAELIPFVSVGLLSLATFGGWTDLPLIFGLVLVMGLSSAFEQPARMALLPSIVRPDTFENAVVVTNTFQKLAMVSGPAAGGVMIAIAGVGSAYFGVVLVLAASIPPLIAIQNPKGPRQGGRRLSPSMIREGVSFVLSRHVLLGAMTLDMFAVIFGGAVALLPVYATDILRVGPTGYGMLYSSLQVGAFAMSAILITKPPIKRTGRALVYSVVAYGVLTLAFGLSRDFLLSVMLYACIGAADQISVVMRHTTIQMATPDHLRGRVSSVNQVFVGASSQVGAIESGVVAALTNATFAVCSGGAAAIAVAILIGWRLPRLFRYEIERQDRRSETEDGRSQAFKHF